MSMSTGGGGGLNAEPNVTPMIDVLMVLLIIFMVIVPSSRKALDVQLPDPNPAPATSTPSTQIVLEVLPGDQFTVNKQPVSGPQLATRLKEIFDPRPDKIIFVKGDPKVPYQAVIQAMDIARGAGVKVIGIPPKDAGA
ncbi:biopolymer transporter ExbD [Roseisolibacter sp. H3M3-2]|uniref:ExbD/TolR family protein n=1 Tax=Roseisolibacter sp. H3M3-2 TaxID=3031323 RepID=UPI0023D985CB|nr:biopolymer transporter ExbD [Roseisolibacter sp. H3M3-2]MDF1501956.1 biopolymer transporter ExbD [Roseisolibacter sp. H3M3-2]